VVIGVRSFEESIAQYRKAFQLPAPRRQRDEAFGAEIAWFEGTPVVLAAPLSTDSWLALRADSRNRRRHARAGAFRLVRASGLLDQRR
jgi:hypothetical protein